ncbi:Tat pathway signal sequence domain protein [Streptomyces abyssomicinicus]|uniref:Tat pathway signal sequence domain protein n=1 Tax=Streptomyces abyssomicinicus TaxID=574929 RepID=UPI00124FBED7|nr:Tat pathway signal sequence domain protein [Streptomyces abyssomicinicus]
MRNRRSALLAAAVLAGAASFGGMTSATAAPTANNVLTYASLGGAAVPVGAQLSASGTVSLSSTVPVGSVNCSSSSFAAKVATNPAAPGTATESNVAVGISAPSCTISLPGATGVNSIAVDLASATVHSNKTVTVSPIRAVSELDSLFGPVECVYEAASITGTASNTDNSITFTNQPLNLTNSEPTCPLVTRFSATYKPVSGPGGKVFVN